MTSLWRHICKR